MPRFCQWFNTIHSHILESFHFFRWWKKAWSPSVFSSWNPLSAPLFCRRLAEGGFPGTSSPMGRPPSCNLIVVRGQSNNSCQYKSDFPFCLFNQVTPEGTFLDVRTIGRFCYEDDLLTLSAVHTETQAESQAGFPRLYTDKTINSLKHRLLVYLWRRAEKDGSATAKRKYVKIFLVFVITHSLLLIILFAGLLIYIYIYSFIFQQRCVV